MGRPRNQTVREKIDQGLEGHWRSFFASLGLRDDQVEQGVDYIRRGFTMEAAARLVLAGGNYKVLLEEGGKAA